MIVFLTNNQPNRVHMASYLIPFIKYVALPVLGFIGGMYLNHIVQRSRGSIPTIGYDKHEAYSNEGNKKMICIEVKLPQVAYSYKVLCVKSNRPIFNGKSELEPLEYPFMSLVDEYTGYESLPFELHNTIQVSSKNVSSESTGFLLFCYADVDDLTLTIWLRLPIFPYFIRKKEVIIPSRK